MNTKIWDPYLKYPYTRLRDLGFPPVVQTMSKEDANDLLAQVAVAAINSGVSAAARTKQILEGGPQDPVLTPRQTRNTKAPRANGEPSLGKGKESPEGA
jgi:hypothetical protein